MNKNTDDIWERLHWIALWTWNISRGLNSLEGTLEKNTDKLVEALNKNSKSADFLAKVWIFIWIVWVFATTVGTIFWILSYLK